ncbi:MAG: acyltransferase, partial [Bradyrhizobium sp.]
MIARPLSVARAISRPAQAAVGAPAQSASLALSNLRGLAIALVLATHAGVAYLASAPAQPRFDQPPYLWVAFPIVDRQRWLGFDIFCASQDIYLMGLLFFLSGLFCFAGMERDGAVGFLRRRFARLGLPLIFGVAVMMPLALYPTYRLSASDPGLAAYASAYLALPFAPCGQMWFLGVLLALTVAAVAMRFLLRPTILHLGRLSQAFEDKPARAFIAFALLSIAAYAPLALVFTPFRWVDWGPFALQLSRPALYALYYGAGLCVGAVGLGA